MFVKKCTQCGKDLPIDMFYKSANSKDGYRSQCKMCCKKNNESYYSSHRSERLKYQKEYTDENKTKVQEYQGKYYKENMNTLKNYYIKHASDKRKQIDLLKTSCVKCGEDRKHVIEFHHIDPSNKSFTISDKSRGSIEALKIEIAKCVCLCANCHKEFHYFYGVKPTNPVEALDEYLL